MPSSVGSGKGHRRQAVEAHAVVCGRRAFAEGSERQVDIKTGVLLTPEAVGAAVRLGRKYRAPGG
jgi:hypothetical protein